MPAWDVGGVSDSPPETRKTKEGRSWVTWVGVGRQWLVTGWLEVSRLSQSITKWGVLPLCAARQPFQKIYVLEGHKGSQKVVKTKSGVELWFRSHPNSLSSVGKPNKAGCLSLSAGKMAAQMTHAAFIWGSVLLLVCLSSFSFYLKNHPFMWKGESYSPGPSRTDKTRPREIPFIPWPSSPVFPWGPQILGGLRVTAQGRNSLYAKIFATPGRSFNLTGLPVPIINKTGRIQGIQGTGQNWKLFKAQSAANSVSQDVMHFSAMPLVLPCPRTQYYPFWIVITTASRALLPPFGLDLPSPYFQLQLEGSFSLKELIISPPPVKNTRKSFPLPSGDNPNSLTLLKGQSGLAPANLSLLISYHSCCHTLCWTVGKFFSSSTHSAHQSVEAVPLGWGKGV